MASFVCARNVIRLFAVAGAGAMLAACAQTTVSQRAERAAFRQAAIEQHRAAAAPAMMRRRVTAARRYATARRYAAPASTPAHGVASFYTEGTKTASGEKFNTLDMTAAHPTLPFGTKLRVTNVKTGQAVTVRVNDRGPYVPGRVVDVSYSAADALGMVGKGLAKVKLDVVE
ncbi:septal ring lytic transglycosylase RlpA family protein [Bradyrhizobium lablabi]|uniref:septal ring lytic transglycosylase RlpA family protein n=1 Tax=Bradyrhizobium lablabi TaxID=722472 RepID=UPI001BABED06|nr:septal ring lytic transglycosylase RlpA family protein [Bradyrhizobium lablabi]MBR1122500.1 septal ring lytic transglycosylase RlpA family protein [Bradyrhizobium lablabi]